MLSRLLISAAVLAPVSAMAAPYNPGFAIDGDAAGNAVRFMLWGAVVIVAAGFVLSASRLVSDGRRLPREAATRVRRRRLPK